MGTVTITGHNLYQDRRYTVAGNSTDLYGLSWHKAVQLWEAKAPILIFSSYGC